MINFYDILYGFAFFFAGPVIFGRKKLRRSVLGRSGRVPRRDGEKPAILFHAVSVGEAKLLGPLVKEVKERLPDWDVTVSSTTPTGIKVAGKTVPDCPVVRFPLDFTWNVKRFFNRTRPDVIVLMELELWPNFLKAAYQRNVPVIVANGRLTRAGAQNYKRFSLVSRRVFERLAHAAVQDESYAARFRAVGVPADRVTVAGNIKYDCLATGADAEMKARVRGELKISEGARVLVAGSTREGEEKILLEIADKICDKTRFEFVLAPRHPERLPEVERLLAERELPFTRKSALDNGSERKGRVILLDKMGELSRIYYAADVVFVGGSLVPLGGQNMLEPAAAGKAIVFGPHTENFREAVKVLLDAGGAVQVKDAAECADAVGRLLADPAEAEALGVKALDALRGSGGAAKRHAEIIRNVALEKISGSKPVNENED